jgi:hypothetical protein
MEYFTSLLTFMVVKDHEDIVDFPTVKFESEFYKTNHIAVSGHVSELGEFIHECVISLDDDPLEASITYTPEEDEDDEGEAQIRSSKASGLLTDRIAKMSGIPLDSDYFVIIDSMSDTTLEDDLNIYDGQIYKCGAGSLKLQSGERDALAMQEYSVFMWKRQFYRCQAPVNSLNDLKDFINNPKSFGAKLPRNSVVTVVAVPEGDE